MVLFTFLVRKKPNSLTELTKLLYRDYDEVLKNAQILKGEGIIELKPENGEIRPIALYDRVIFDFSA
jgi:predicted transcriptional regulator